MPARHLLNLAGNRLHTLPLVVMYLTDGCNSRCITCDIWRSPRRNMSMALVDQIAQACGELRVRWVLLSGGEAMQHPEWPAIAQKLRAQGTHVMLLTNGLLLRKQAEDVAASVDEVIVSLDGGTAQTYEAIRGVDAFDLVLEGVAAVRALGIPVTTRTTVQQANFREIPLIIESALAVDASSVSFLTVDVGSVEAFGPRFAADESLKIANTPPPGALAEHEIPELSRILDDVEQQFASAFATGRMAEPPEKLRLMVDYFGGLLGQNAFPRRRCNTPHTSTVIEVDGTLRPCYFLPSYGRLTPASADLTQAINTDPARALRQAYRAGQRPECERCVCPLYLGPRTLLRL